MQNSKVTLIPDVVKKNKKVCVQKKYWMSD